MHEIFDPRKRDTPIIKDLILGISLLTFVIAAAVFTGFKIGELKINAWGAWIGAYVGALALIGSILGIKMKWVTEITHIEE